MSSTSDQWVTSIAQVSEDDVLIRGYSLAELVGQVSFTDACFLVMTGELPSKGQSGILDAIFVTLIDHGISPSSMIVRMLASCGTPIQAALAGGVSSIADFHGGSGEELARRLSLVVEAANGGDVSPGIRSLVEEYRAGGRRFEGFGHPQHGGQDPRAGQLIGLARAAGVAGVHVAALDELQGEIERQTGRALVPNVTAAVAALLLDLGFPWQAMRGFIIAPRVVGLTAHFVEERQQNSRWRHAPGESVTYTGPQRRSVPHQEGEQ